jgi:hypothetical protein
LVSGVLLRLLREGRDSLDDPRTVERMDGVVVTIFEHLKRRSISTPGCKTLAVLGPYQHIGAGVEYQHRPGEGFDLGAVIEQLVDGSMTSALCTLPVRRHLHHAREKTC